MKRTILLPCAGPIPEDGTRPPWLLTTPTGELVVRRAANSVAPDDIGRIVVGISDIVDQRFTAAEAVRRSFADCAGLDVDVVTIDYATAGPAETVNELIRRAGVTGPIAIKDGHSFFDPVPGTTGSFVAVCDLRAHLDVASVGKKSFVTCNEQGLVSDIVEKTVCSNLISVGLYAFADTALFLSCYRRMMRLLESSAFFVSHLISAAVAGGEIVVPVNVSGFVDVDGGSSWTAFRDRHMTLVVDLDGVVFENHSAFFPPYWEEEDHPIEANVAHLRELQGRGAQLVFMTARPERYRQKTLNTLLALGLDAHALVTGCQHSRRYLINDFAPSNPYPSAVALNLGRNMPDLAKLIR